MGYVYFQFPTRAEAEAFKQGVEYVNDSACEVEEILEQPDAPPNERFQVKILDEDNHDDEEDEDDPE